MPGKINEDQIRKEMINPQLERAGWYLRDHSKVNIEIPVDGYTRHGHKLRSFTSGKAQFVTAGII